MSHVLSDAVGSLDTRADLPDHRTILNGVYHEIEIGYRFLYHTAQSTGHWGDPRSSALALMCLLLRPGRDTRWIRAATSYLTSTQTTDRHQQHGSWNEEIWDTAMCVLALLRAGASPKAVEKALAFIRAKYSKGLSSWHGEPWETCWALIALLADQQPLDTGTIEQIETSRRWLRGLQTLGTPERGKIVASHYTAYFVLIEHYAENRKDRKLHRDTEAREMAEAFLEQQLHTAPSATREGGDVLWTDEAWSNGQILLCLCKASVPFVKELSNVAKIREWFTTAREGGEDPEYWEDVEDTASAILGLEALSAAIAHDAKEHEARLLHAECPPLTAGWWPVWESDRRPGFVSIHANKRFLKSMLVIGSVSTGIMGLVQFWDEIVVRVVAWFR